MSELVMSRDELMILINELYGGDERHFKVAYPFYGESLFTMDTQGSELMGIIDRTRLDSCARDFKPNGIDQDEMVDSRHLVDSLVSSSIIEHRNKKDIIDWLRKLNDQAKDPSMRAKPFLIGLDTNILYSCFISRHLSFEDSNKLPFNAGFRYIICDIVREEVDHHVEHKYTNDEIEALKTTFKRRDLISQFKNRCDRKARKALLAFNECQYLRQELKAAGTPGKNSYNSEQNDREIARSYLRYARDNNCDAFLITADEKMVVHSRTVDIPTKQLLVPTELPKRCKIDPWSVKDLIYDLSVTMGAISVEQSETTMIMGEWRGKTSDDYSDEKVKVLISDQGMHDRISKELEICRKVRDIFEPRSSNPERHVTGG